jgi:hypothetical protein
MMQAFLPILTSNCDDSHLLGLSPNIFAFALNYSPEGFKYLTFQIVDDQIIQKDADIQFAAFGLG